MAPPLDPSAFDEADPAAFYLPGVGRADMEALADATLVVAGKRLPAHRSVLSLQSGVLRGLFVDLRSSSSSSGGEDAMVLEAPFQDCILFDTALFLRFCYRPEDLTPVNLAAVPGSLPGLVRLAHKLDAPRVEQTACECMMGKVRSATRTELIELATAADRCQLPELRLSCISQVARRLASEPDSLAAAFADAALLAERCDKSVLAQLVGLLAASGGNHVPGGLPALGAAMEALQQAANPGSFEWVLERYLERPSAVGQCVESPWFSAAGKHWCFKVYPGGYVEQSAGHLSVFLACKQTDVRAKHTVTLVDQAAEEPQHVTCTSGVNWFDAKNSYMSWGWGEFASHETLRSRPGYLAGDRLVLRARVEVVL